MTQKDLEVKIEELQMRQAFQDHTIEALNQALTDQQLTIDRLEYQLKHMVDKLKQIPTSNIASMSEETPPPHY